MGNFNSLEFHRYPPDVYNYYIILEKTMDTISY